MKSKPTKTLNPLHFEDLEPHRFEDLVRQLTYDFRDWQSIEATGRSGSDAGFDIRAWEKVQEVANQPENDDEEIGTYPMDGKLWMIQCKREKSLGPAQVTKIINEGVDDQNPPYGYILTAPVYFSKKSYDAFRNTLRNKGVTEFYIWGKAELEDMLALPKNDHVLFTFFGISLSVRRRSKTTEVKFQVNNKNKLLRILTDGEQSQNFHKSVLIRDIKDENYPYKEAYLDFEKNPRWSEHVGFGHHPRGLLVHIHENWAYIDEEKKEYDFTPADDLIYREGENRKHDPKIFEKRQLINDFWKHLPRKNQAHYRLDGLILFQDMLIIDDKGDIQNDFPHIYLDFTSEEDLFRRIWESLKIGDDQIFLNDDEYKRIKVFPSVFPQIQNGKIYKDKYIQWDPETLRLFNVISGPIDTLFDIDNKYSFLKSRDAILVAGAESNKEKLGIEVTHKYQTTVKEYIETHRGEYSRAGIERQVGRKVQDNEKLEVYEFEKAYEWKFQD